MMKKLSRYKYPKCRSYIRLFRSKSSNRFMLFDYIDEEAFEISRDEYVIARGLDGKTDPYAIDPQMSPFRVREVLYNLKNIYDITTKRRIERLGLFTWNFTLFDFKKTSGIIRFICRILTYFQLLLLIPVTAFGVYSLLTTDGFSYDFDYNSYMLGLVVFSIIGIILHEAGHAVSGAAFGAKLFEAGIIFGIPGAYVMMASDKSRVKSRIKRVQINAAGIQNNMLLACFLLILAQNAGESIFYILYGGSIANICFAVMNTLLFSGLDGYSVIRELLGFEEDPITAIKNAVKSRTTAGLPTGIGNALRFAAFLSVFLCEVAILVLMISRLFGQIV